jgi:hypothetical protein
MEFHFWEPSGEVFNLHLLTHTDIHEKDNARIDKMHVVNTMINDKCWTEFGYE